MASRIWMCLLPMLLGAAVGWLAPLPARHRTNAAAGARAMPVCRAPRRDAEGGWDVPKPKPAMDRSPYDDEEDDEEDWDDEPDVPWDEPSASEEEEARTDVAKSADFLPLLLKAKYGDGWETLLEPYTAEGEEGEEESRSFIELYEHTDDDKDDEDDEPLPSEEGAMARIDFGALSRTEEGSIEEIASLSPQLAEFVQERRAGNQAGAPEPFPASEWLYIFVSAMTDARFEELTSTWANTRVKLAVNFDDVNVEDAAHASETPDPVNSALAKATALHAATGLPAIAETTCCYVEGSGAKPQSETLYTMDDSVTELISRMTPNSAPEREVIFSSAAAFVSDNVSLVAEGGCSFPISMAGLPRATIATSTALDQLFLAVAEAMDLKFEVKKKGKTRNTAGSRMLKERIIREAKVLDASILKVSSFINHMVDVEMMEACGEELAERLEGCQPTKVLTVEATGLLPAVFVAKALQVPVVFARKAKQIGASDSYQTSYKSSTASTTKDLYVSTEYLNSGDRILIIDDFLAGAHAPHP